jgi:thiamine-phosphate pyrophosphorylase
MNTPMNKAISGLYAIMPQLVDTAGLLARTRAALAGGARLLHGCNKTADENLRREQPAALRELCRSYGATLIINDSVELAGEIDFDGVHAGANAVAVISALFTMPVSSPQRASSVSYFR